MGVKHLLFLLFVLILISGCTAEKTIPIITNVVKEPTEQKEVQEQPIDVEKEEVVEADNTSVEEENEEQGIEEEKEELLPAANTIIIKDLKLDPQELTILKGDTVIWKHEDTWEQEGSTRHYLAAHSNEFRSPILFYGDTFNHTFNKNGTFTYIDIIYKEKASMRGTIIVE